MRNDVSGGNRTLKCDTQTLAGDSALEDEKIQKHTQFKTKENGVVRTKCSMKQTKLTFA